MEKIIITGVNILSKNRGVQALGYGAESFIKKVFPSTEIEFFSLTVASGDHLRQTNISKKDILRFIIYLVFPFFSSKDPIIIKIKKSDYIFDLTEGDSFSDIYGIKRFILNIIFKFTLRKFGKKYILLQQTIGPFKRNWTKFISKLLIKKVDRVYVRDYDSYNLLQSLDIPTLLFPDVALFLDTQKPESYSIPFDKFIALNVNGLLFFDSYSKNLIEKGIYHRIITDIVKFLLDKGENILIVPHTYSVKGDMLEDDLAASRKIISEFGNKYAKKLKVVDKEMNACEMKYVLSKAQFTIASRMHACIGSLTSAKLAIALAYSYKFRGNFKNFGLENWVVNLYEKNISSKNVIEIIKKAFNEHEMVSKSINDKIRNMQNDCIKNFKADLLHE